MPPGQIILPSSKAEQQQTQQQQTQQQQAELRQPQAQQQYLLAADSQPLRSNTREKNLPANCRVY
jgi:hypothetical protein